MKQFDNDTKIKIVKAMEDYGGSFITQLAKLWWTADNINKGIIERTFDNYFNTYYEQYVKKT